MASSFCSSRTFFSFCWVCTRHWGRETRRTASAWAISGEATCGQQGAHGAQGTRSVSRDVDHFPQSVQLPGSGITRKWGPRRRAGQRLLAGRLGLGKLSREELPPLAPRLFFCVCERGGCERFDRCLPAVCRSSNPSPGNPGESHSGFPWVTLLQGPFC